MNFNQKKDFYEDQFENVDDNGFWAPAPYEPADDDRFFSADSFSHQSENRSSFNFATLPWKQIIIVLGILTIIICCVVFRNQITYFLKLVLSWVITITVIAILVYFLFRAIFGGRRRW